MFILSTILDMVHLSVVTGLPEPKSNESEYIQVYSYIIFLNLPTVSIFYHQHLWDLGSNSILMPQNSSIYYFSDALKFGSASTHLQNVMF